MTNEVKTWEALTEASIQAALIEARSDIFVAAQLLRVTAVRLNRAIQISPVLAATLEETKKAGPGATQKQIEDAIRDRIGLYRVTGLDALHDLAAMELGKNDNSAWGQVKFAAAAKLVEGVASQSSSGELEVILRELREDYQKSAPRLRVIRERTTIETLPDERVIDQAPEGSE